MKAQGVFNENLVCLGNCSAVSLNLGHRVIFVSCPYLLCNFPH